MDRTEAMTPDSQRPVSADMAAARAKGPRATTAPRQRTRTLPKPHHAEEHSTPPISPALMARATEQATMVAHVLEHRGQEGPEAMDKISAVVQAALQGITPQDALEAMLAAQMVAVHMAAMDALLWGSGLLQSSKSSTDPSVARMDVAIRLFRMFTAQVKALTKYRNRGQQTVRVEHVTIERGGQAIVGTVVTEGRGALRGRFFIRN